MTSVFPGNGDIQSFTYVSKTDLGPVSAPLANIFNPPKTSTPPPSVLNPSPPSSNQYAIYGLHNESPTPIANVPAKPLTSATLLTAAINTPASTRAIPNVVYKGVPNFHSAYLANNSYQMTNNGIVKQSTFVNTPMTTNAIPPGDLTILNHLAQLEQSRPQSTVAPTQPPPSFTPLSVSFDLPEENTTDQSTDYTNYYYIAGGILIALLILRRN